MIKIADICPLFFSPLKYRYSRDMDYIQKFHTSDSILLQLISTSETPSDYKCSLNSVSYGSTADLKFIEYSINDMRKMYYTILSNLQNGIYTVTLLGNESEPFMICDELKNSALISVSHKDNNSIFDNIFWVGDERLYVNMRMEGGFKPNNVIHKLESESYRNQFQEINDLYAYPYDVEKLSIGDSLGVPSWFSRYLNRILCLSYFSINGILYRRSDGSVPEKTETIEGSGLYYVTVDLEKADNDIAGIGGKIVSGSSQTPTGISFNISGAKDGDMLIYDGDDNAFVNSNVIK